MNCGLGGYYFFPCCKEVSIENRKYYDCGYSYCWSRECAPINFKDPNYDYDCFISSWSYTSPGDGGCSGAYWTEKK